MNSFIAVNQPLLNGNEKKYLNECIDSGWISSEGPFVQRFEDALSNKLNRKYGIAVTNGTAAIDAAIEAIGISAGDEVIMPTFTIISCISQIVRNGGIPILVDCDPFTWNMDVSKIESLITSKTKAIMVVHIYGLPTDIDPVINICKRYNLKLIEDAAELIGQTYKGRPCGSFGDVSTLSFYPNKHITTGEGGMILTNDTELAENCRELRNLCFRQPKRFVHERLGWNLRMTNMQAAIGLAQFERLNEFINKKRAIGKLYNNLLSEIPNVQLPLPKTDYAENIYWVYGIVLNERYGNVDNITKALYEKGIGTRPFFFPMHQQPVLLNKGLFKNQSFPISENLYRRGFYLPSGLALSEPEIRKVATTLRRILEENYF